MSHSHLKELANIACNTFPPPFRNESYEGPFSTTKGDLALERGRWANSQRKKAPYNSGSRMAFNKGYPSMSEIEKELGGVQGFFTLFAMHYCGMFTNPRMNVLFDTRDEQDAKTSAMEHGKRIAATLLDTWFGTSHYAKLGRGRRSGLFTVDGTHLKAKNCPMRPKSQQVSLPKNSQRYSGNRRFTTDQRDSWVGHVMIAAEECKCSIEFQNKLGLWLAMTVSGYAPFVDEQTGNLDWMEEQEYK